MGFTGWAGALFSVFFSFFLLGFQRVARRCFYSFFLVFGSPWGVLFCPFFGKVQLSSQKCGPPIFAYSTAFWLDFQGFGASKIEKKQQKRVLKKRRFLSANKTSSKSVFTDFGVLLGLHFGVRGDQNSETYLSVSVALSGVPPGTFWDHFWHHFGVILGSF